MANQGSLLDVLKKKMRSMKEDLESSQELAQENHQKFIIEKRRREEVSFPKKRIKKIFIFLQKQKTVFLKIHSKFEKKTLSIDNR